jgi:hypothetical protein
MILISHRGNIIGREVDKENNPDYIAAAISKGFDVEVDVWLDNGKFILGHDYPQYEIDDKFLDISGLWIHCKSVEVLSVLVSKPEYNCFFHNTDDVVLTSKNYLWTYPGKPLYNNSICVLPELIEQQDISNAIGVCSDFIERYRRLL